jgi:para-nitrobenzyl esterase
MESTSRPRSLRNYKITLTALLMTGLLGGCKEEIAVTEYGIVEGSIQTQQHTIQWLGIPYAKPPIGPLRWQAPQPPTSWKEPLKVTKFSSACTQLGTMYGPANDGFSQDLSLRDTFGLPVGSEDCLYLNIQRPFNTNKKLPVVVYLHGGSNIAGAGSLYDGSELVQQDVVFVTVNYRLGLFGWLNHPALKSGTNNLSDSGNFGTLDVLQALTFVHNNIEAFGGDPSNVTLMGQSAGASNAFSMMVSPAAKDLFKRVVMLSPGGLNQTPKVGADYANGLLVTLVIMNQLAADQASAVAFFATKNAEWIKTFLYSNSASTLLTATSLVPALRVAPSIFVDGLVQPADPYSAVAAGQFNNVPLLIGNTHEEGKLYTQSGMIVDSPTLWGMLLSFNPDDPASTPVTLENVIKPELLPADRPQQGTCGAAGFVAGGYNDFANLCGAAVSTAQFKTITNQLLPLLSSKQPQVYAYEWSWNQQPYPWNIIHGSAHAGDIGFWLGHFNIALFNNGYSQTNQPGRLALSDAMMKSLVAFARNDDPNHAGLGDTWLPWSPSAGAPKRFLFDADDSQKQVGMQFQ